MNDIVNHDPLNPVYAAFIAIDWAKTKHDYCLSLPGEGRLEKGVLSHDPVKIQHWLDQLHERFGGQKIAIALEQSKGPFINALYGYDFLDIYPINPQTAAKYRRMFTPSGAKNDSLDAASMLDLLVKHRDQLRLLRLDTPEARKLNAYCQKRREVVDRRTAAIHRLAAALESYYPQAITMTGDLHTPMAQAFLQRWPSFQKLKSAREKTLRDFYHRHNSRSIAAIEKRLALARQSLPLTTDPAACEAGQTEVEALCMEVQTLNRIIAHYDAEIQKLFKAQPNHRIFASFPGAGATMAPRLSAALGSNTDRYCDSAEVQKLSGIAPIVVRSNERSGTFMRQFCPKFHRQTFHEFAGSSIQYSSWANAYYEQQKRRGASGSKAKRALAYKWIRIIYRCWQNDTPYNEQAYIQSLKKRNSPLIAFMNELDAEKN
jgi:hypothetical protein